MHLSPARIQRLSEEDKGKLRQVLRTHCRQRHFQDISDVAAVGRSLWRAKGRTIVWGKLPDFVVLQAPGYPTYGRATTRPATRTLMRRSALPAQIYTAPLGLSCEC